VFAGEDDFHFVGVGRSLACLELVFPRSEVVVLDVVADHLEIEPGLVGVENAVGVSGARLFEVPQGKQGAALNACAGRVGRCERMKGGWALSLFVLVSREGVC
jgi:hypothetical protein